MPKSKGRAKVKAKRRPYVPAPKPKAKPKKPSSKWYVAFVVGLGAIGVLIIALNYLNILPFTGGVATPQGLWIGLGFIAAAFMAATRLR